MCVTGEYFWYEDTCRTHDYNYNEICARLMHVICTRIRACLMNIMPTYYYHTTTVLQPHYFVLLRVTLCYFMLLHVTSHYFTWPCITSCYLYCYYGVQGIPWDILLYRTMILLPCYYHATLMLLWCSYHDIIMLRPCYYHNTSGYFKYYTTILLPCYYHATIVWYY